MESKYCDENGIQRKATESVYRTVFNTEFNLSFFQPKKDLCDMCHRYENGSKEEKREMEDEYQQHLRNKKLARDIKAANKERAKQSTKLCSAVFDLQQVLSVPKSDLRKTPSAICGMNALPKGAHLKLVAAFFFSLSTKFIKETFGKSPVRERSPIRRQPVKNQANVREEFRTTMADNPQMVDFTILIILIHLIGAQRRKRVGKQ
ncbi:unnamed protein product [Acanthoscelides obtectus]|uniref:Uncharacterized protein n=1 Tax=Acanthoscelides obtectus TaxID=200917 RepID=A0A9P0L9T0_ACAOB|nr:unnamed protein product [Acanthoscelides obtectus]CAK1624383.1 hypothetical protein AOBTE_LOCUS2534 [Acanthoscelides obtectus]